MNADAANLAAHARHERWQHYLTDLRGPSPPPPSRWNRKALVRVAGLVLEATGLRVPLGSVCRIQMPSSGKRPARYGAGQAEVVGFSGDRAYLMPTDEVQGFWRVAPPWCRTVSCRPAAAARSTRHPWRDGEDRGPTCPWATVCWAAWSDSHGHPLDGPLEHVHTEPMLRRPPSMPWTATRCARRWTPACAHQRHALPSAAASAWACCRHRRGQVGAAGLA